MNWDDLRYFLALSRTKTVSGAGRELGVKHTTVARRIVAFEQSLGSRLFERLPDGYVMTQAGENLYKHALIIEDQAQAIERQIFGLDTQLQGSLKLTAAHEVLTRLVVPHLSKFIGAYPSIELLLSSSIELADLAARQADIALRLTANPPDYLIGKKVLPLAHGLYASDKYLSENSNPNHLIEWSGNEKKPEWVRQHFVNAQVSIRVSDVTSMLACVKNHMGIARLPCYIADTYVDLRRLDIAIKPSNWGFWVLSHVDLRATARVRACREFLEDIIQQQKTLIGGLDSHYR